MIVKAPEHSSLTTTPVEVAYYFYKVDPYGFPHQRQLLEAVLMGLDTPTEEFVMDHSGNHVGRIILKTILDPDRLAPIDLVDAYRKERKTYHSPDEEKFFAKFIENWGVLKR